MKIKPDEELILRTVRWLWWHNYNMNGNMHGIAAHEVYSFLYNTKLVTDKIRYASDPVGRVHYRMEKLSKAGLLTCPHQWRNRYQQYYLAATVDPWAHDIPRVFEAARKRADERLATRKEELEKAAARIFPGTFDLRLSLNQTPRHDPDQWPISVQVSSPLPTFQYFLSLAFQEAKRQEALAEPEDDTDLAS